MKSLGFLVFKEITFSATEYAFQWIYFKNNLKIL